MPGPLKLALRLILPALFLLAVVSPARATLRSFPAGSLLIPADPCWQPATPAPAAPGCPGAGSPSALAGTYGLVYRLQRAGVPVYRVGTAAPGGPPALTLYGDAGPPVRALSDAAAGGPAGPRVDYAGPLFVIDQRDLNESGEALLAAHTSVRRHLSLLPFTAAVDNLLRGLPNRLHPADAAAAARLEALLSLAGLTGVGGLHLEGTTGAGIPLSRCNAASAPDLLTAGSCGLPALLDDLLSVPSTTASHETVTLAPLVADGVIFTAGSDYPGGAGHLRATAVAGRTPAPLWDAAERVPPAGATEPPASAPGLAALAPLFSGTPGQRQIFTAIVDGSSARPVVFSAAAAHVLAPQLGVASAEEAAALINAVRGRLAPTPGNPTGTGERGNRLGGFSRSAPALVGASQLVDGGWQRDRLLYIGSDHGLLHALRAGRRQVGGGYRHGDDEGTELWAFLPGSLLASLTAEPLSRAGGLPAVQLDGSPLVDDLFIDTDGDGQREWRTVLVATASAGTQGTVFALDISAPLAPRLLWETTLPGLPLGPSRGAALGWSSPHAGEPPRLYLTAALSSGPAGLLAAALDAASGALLWHFTAPYPPPLANLREPPTLPTLLRGAGGDTLLCGDPAGRLWALEVARGGLRGGGPLWQTPGGVDEPIGGRLATRGRLILLASGGVDYAEATGRYGIYAVELLPTGGVLRWSVPLAPGERVWGAPEVDSIGRVFIAIGDPERETGRLAQLTADGSVAAGAALPGPPAGGVALAAGALVTVTAAGELLQAGELQPASAGDEPGRIRPFSWRVR